MTRQNLFSDAWDGENEEAGTRHRVFWRPDDARMGATLYELAPGAPETRMHMHFGAEEMFFVLSGRPVFRNQHGQDSTRSAIPPKNPLRSSRSVPGASRMSSPTPSTDMHGWRLAIPIRSYSREAATPASSLASRSRSSRSFGRFSAVARRNEEAARAVSSLSYLGSSRTFLHFFVLVELKIRDAYPSEAEALVALIAQLGYPTSADAVRERVERLWSSEVDRLVVAELEGEIPASRASIPASRSHTTPRQPSSAQSSSTSGTADLGLVRLWWRRWRGRRSGGVAASSS